MECFLLYLGYNGLGDFFCGHAGEVMGGVYSKTLDRKSGSAGMPRPI